MRNLNLILVGMLVGACHSSTAEKPTLPSVVEMAPTTEEIESLESFTLRAMEECAVKSSDTYRRVTAKTVASIVAEQIPDRTAAEIYIAMLCTESRFDNGAKSPVGATGIAQVMPCYAKDFARLCGFGDVSESDVSVPSINVTLGACYFNHLTKTLKPSTLAIAAYNAGPNSSSIKRIQAMAAPVEETAGYVTKVTYLKEKLSHGTQKD